MLSKHLKALETRDKTVLILAHLVTQDNWINAWQWWNGQQHTYTSSVRNHKKQKWDNENLNLAARGLNYDVCAHQQVVWSVGTVRRTSMCGSHKRVGLRGKSTNDLSAPTASLWRTYSGHPLKPQYVRIQWSQRSESWWNRRHSSVS